MSGSPPHTLLELLPDIIFEYRLVPSPGFVYVSPSVTAIVGYTPEEHYADPGLGLRIVHPDDRHVLEEIMRDPDESKSHHIRWQTRAGDVVMTSQRVRAVRDRDGSITGVVGVSRPVAAGTPEWQIRVGDLRLDLSSQKVWMDGRTARLTPTESQVLALLASAPGPVTRREIVERLWGTYHTSGERAIEVHVSNIRKKLESEPHRPRRIVTVRGVGYRLVQPVDGERPDHRASRRSQNGTRATAAGRTRLKNT